MAKYKTFKMTLYGESPNPSEDGPEVLAEYAYHKGSPDTYCSFAGTWDQGWPPEVEILKTTIGGLEFEPTPAEQAEWATYIMENREEDDGGGIDPRNLRD